MIGGLATIRRAIGIVGIAEQQTFFYEKFYRIVTDGFPGIGCVSVAIGLRDKFNDRGNSTQKSLRIGPWGIRLKIEQGQ